MCWCASSPASTPTSRRNRAQWPPGRQGPAWITVVGDSDQSIYAFRGADIRNIQDFEQDFPNAKTIMLEQNYRSTQTILDAANAVIAHNEGRKPKKLWTALGKGEPIVGYAADNAQQEAAWIASEIARLHVEAGVAYSDVAIMYRANAQSRSLEEALIKAGLPYQLIGGTRFYERREVKDAIAYLQAIVNPADDVNMRAHPQRAQARAGGTGPNHWSRCTPTRTPPRSSTACSTSTSWARPHAPRHSCERSAT